MLAVTAAFHFRPESRLLCPTDAKLIAFAPLCLGAEVLVLVGKIELERIRQRDAFRYLQPRALFGDVPHDAIHAGQPVVEIDPPLDEGLVADQRATLDHGDEAFSLFFLLATSAPVRRRATTIIWAC